MGILKGIERGKLTVKPPVITEAMKPPWGDITYIVSNGCEITVFNDVDSWDYIDSFKDQHGAFVNIWDEMEGDWNKTPYRCIANYRPPAELAKSQWGLPGLGMDFKPKPLLPAAALAASIIGAANAARMTMEGWRTFLDAENSWKENARQIAHEAAAEGRKAALDSQFQCPECFAGLSGVWMEKPYFEATWGQGPTTAGGFIQDAVAEGVQECSECGHKFEVND